jgi:glycosyltransferase involved in cell wall biosynthesis
VFNEEENIHDVVYQVVSFIRKYIENFEVIIVNDGSIDSTLSILNDIKLLYPELKIITHSRNKGYGYAIRTGIVTSRKDWIFIMDADGQFHIDDFMGFWENKEYYDFIIGYRVVRNDAIYRKYLGRIGTCLANLILFSKIKDINCAFKLFRGDILRGLPLLSTGGNVSFEILYRLLKSQKKFIQLPVRHYQRKKGKQTGGNPRVIFKIIGEGLKTILSG